MRASQLLSVWERAAPQPPVERALTLLTAARPGMCREDLATLSIGERDAQLLDLREEIFGSTLQVFTPCPRCGERFEFNLQAADLGGGLPAAKDTEAWNDPRELLAEDFRVRFRLPNCLDLEAAAAAEEAARAREILIERCVLGASHNGQMVGLNDLPREVLDQLASEIATLDPRTEINLNVQCPVCGHTWTLLFDIASFLWEELNALAKRLLREIATLARNFGWHERDILAMSSTRRQIYLELAR